MRQVLLTAGLLFSVFAFGQKGYIKGTITDSLTNEPMVAVTVLLKGYPIGTYSDLDGNFIVSVEPGTYTLECSFMLYKTRTLIGVTVHEGDTASLGSIAMVSDNQMSGVVVTAQVIRSTENALMNVKQKSVIMVDGISSAKFKLTGDGTAGEAAKRVTGVSVEGGKYVYVRGLGDRYSKTTLNGLNIPGLDPDRNSLQMDIFPSSLISNILVSKNFSAELPADFTGGLVNIELMDFPDKRIFDVSISLGYNPFMHFNSGFLGYTGSSTDFLGFDNGNRALPAGAGQGAIPSLGSGASSTEINSFVKSFNPILGASTQTSLMDMGFSLVFGNSLALGKNSGSNAKQRKLGYVFSLSYSVDYKFYDEVAYGEYQRLIDPDVYELRYATTQDGKLGEKSVLIGSLAGLSYKSGRSKYRLTLMHIQNGTSTAGKFNIYNDGEAVGQSGYFAKSDNLEYNQRSISNLFIGGFHNSEDKSWDVDWRLSPTLSVSNDPDIRRTAFTYTPVDTSFIAGAGGNPTRIWRNLYELNLDARVDFTKSFKLLGKKSIAKFGLSQVYKYRDYEILRFDIQFTGSQHWQSADANDVLKDENIYPNRPNGIYYQSGNSIPNPNAYNSSVLNTGIYVSDELELDSSFRIIAGLRAEKYTQWHTGRDQIYASGDVINGKNLDNSKVLESFDLFPSLTAIYELAFKQKVRFGYSRTIARPSFKELSFAQILDPITNRIFNGSLFQYGDWSGKLVETRIHNVDLRWDRFYKGEEMVSFSAFYKSFNNPIELIRIPEQQTSTEYQPRNVGNGQLLGLEFEFRMKMIKLWSGFREFMLSGNITIVKSQIDMSATEYNARKLYEKTGETIGRSRQMAGQAPYVINAGISYEHGDDAGITAGMFYNVKGPTLYIVGAGLFPDIYTEPFHSVNLSFNKKFGENGSNKIDFGVSNLLNDKIESFYHSYGAEKQVFSSLNPGISFKIGYSHSF